MSQEATIHFQDDFGIKVDGIFGPSTEGKFMEVIDAIQDVVSQYAPQPLDKRYWGLAPWKPRKPTSRLWACLPPALPPWPPVKPSSTPYPEPQEQPTSGDW